MFKRLQEKWGVSTRQFWIIFFVFGLTGTTTAFITRFITGWLGMDASTHWISKISLRLGMLLFGYQFILLGYAALLGQWSFFWKYEKKLLGKLGILPKTNGKIKPYPTKNPLPSTPEGKLFIQEGISTVPTNTKDFPARTRLAIFASGTGTNAEKIILHFKIHPYIKVALVVSNKPGAGVLSIARAHGIPELLLEREPFFNGDGYAGYLKNQGINFIVLAGFLWKIPETLIAAYPDKIINIHPALLPNYGGKGMYGNRVHASVIAAGDKESGITIHYVNENFDEGKPIFQAKCLIEEGETADSLAKKIHQLEHVHFPKIIEQLLSK